MSYFIFSHHSAFCFLKQSFKGLAWPGRGVPHRRAMLPGTFHEECSSCFFTELFSKQQPARIYWVRWNWVPCCLFFSVSCFFLLRNQNIGLVNGGNPVINFWGEVLKYMYLQNVKLGNGNNSHLFFGHLEIYANKNPLLYWHLA